MTPDVSSPVEVFLRGQHRWPRWFVDVPLQPGAFGRRPPPPRTAPQALRLLDQDPGVLTVAFALAALALQPAVPGVPGVDAQFVRARHALAAVVHALAG